MTSLSARAVRHAPARPWRLGAAALLAAVALASVRWSTPLFSSQPACYPASCTWEQAAVASDVLAAALAGGVVLLGIGEVRRVAAAPRDGVAGPATRRPARLALGMLGWVVALVLAEAVAVLTAHTAEAIAAVLVAMTALLRGALVRLSGVPVSRRLLVACDVGVLVTGLALWGAMAFVKDGAASLALVFVAAAAPLVAVTMGSRTRRCAAGRPRRTS